MKKSFLGLAAIALLVTAGTASAHVTVKPNEAGIGVFQSFSVGVPTEKQQPTTGLRLVIPVGLEYVTPNVKPGWKIEVKKDGTGEDAKITELIWSGNSIPAGQRDEFIFSAKLPTEETDLQWKAYQTYEDGSIISWDREPNASHDEEGEDSGPYSVTKVINDLNAPADDHNDVEKEKKQNLPMILSLAALLISLATLARQRRMERK